MSVETDLRRRIERLIADAGARQEARREEVHREMSRLEDRLERFETLARQWLDELVVPRLEALGSVFPNREPLTRVAGSYRAVQAFRHTDDFPVDARVEARVWLDVASGRSRLTFESSIIPILMDYEREGSIEYGLEAADPVAIGVFLDERIVRFVRDYLRVREPDSPYQKDRLVTDPVCGMVLRRADVAAVLDHEGRRYYFCVAGCRERFASDPDRYLATLAFRPASVCGEIPSEKEETP